MTRSNSSSQQPASSCGGRNAVLAADRLWFGEAETMRDRTAAAAVFADLAAGGDRPAVHPTLNDTERRSVSSIPSDGTAMAMGRQGGPCLRGSCCSHRRRRMGQSATSTSVFPPPGNAAAAGGAIDGRSSPNNQAQHRHRTVCVIGAGPSGLIVLKELLDKGLAVRCYERSDRIGGAFAGAYDGATMTSSNALTAFGCYPVTEYYAEDCVERPMETNGWETMWTCEEYCDYLRSFGRRFGLGPYISTSTEVVSVTVEGDNGDGPGPDIARRRWKVGTRRRVSDENRRNNDSEATETLYETFDAVCVCSGLHQRPNIPSWCRNLSPPRNSDVASAVHKRSRRSRIVHSSEISNGTDFAGQNVVVVGLGESGSDISLLVARHAKSVRISVRDKSGSGYVLPRYTNGEVGDLNTSRGFGGREVWGPADHRMFASLVNKARSDGNDEALRELALCFLGTEEFSELDLMAIEWNDKYCNLPYDRFGTKNYAFLEAISKHGAEVIGEISSLDDIPLDTDTIILCTGFESRFDFFQSHPSLPDPNLAARASDHRDRYHHMIHLDIGISLAFIGFARPAFGAVPALSELSARYWALLLTGERTLAPAAAQAERDTDRAYEERLFRRDAGRIKSLVQYQRTMDAIARHIGCLPPLGDLERFHPELAARVRHSALGGAQYRLVGDGWSEAAWGAVLRYPLPEFTRQPRSAFRAKVETGMFE